MAKITHAFSPIKQAIKEINRVNPIGMGHIYLAFGFLIFITGLTSVALLFYLSFPFTTIFEYSLLFLAGDGALAIGFYFVTLAITEFE